MRSALRWRNAPPVRVTSIFCTANRPVEVGKRFFGTKPPDLIRERAQRRALVERKKPALPVSQRCRLLAVSRSSVPGGDQWQGSHDHGADRPALSGAGPSYGSRRMAAWLATQRQVVNRKRVRRLMWLMGLWRSIISGRIQPRQQRSTLAWRRYGGASGSGSDQPPGSQHQDRTSLSAGAAF